jgi:tetratricopeptide (TPR) repeat protein
VGPVAQARHPRRDCAYPSTHRTTRKVAVIKHLRLAAIATATCVLWASAAAQSGYSIQRVAAYVGAHDANGALAYAQAWAKAEPGNADAWSGVGIAYGSGLHQPADAVAAFQKALAIRPDYSECLNAMGVEYLNLNKYPPAEQAFKHAAETAKIKSNYWNNLAVAYTMENKRDEALAAIDQNARLAGPTAAAGDWYVIGNGYYQMMEYPKAVDAFGRALRMNPRMAMAWNNLGTAEQRLGNAAEALRDYKQAGALGDSLGNQNYASLQAAIAAAQAEAQRANQPMNGIDRAAAISNARYNYDHTWHDRNAQRP